MATPTPTRKPPTRTARPRATTTATAEPLEDDLTEEDLEQAEDSGDVVDQSGASVVARRSLPTRSTRRRAPVRPAPVVEDDVDDEPETTDVPATVRGYDFVFTVPAEVDDWPLDVLVAFEEGKPAIAVRGMLGPEQWRDLQLVKPRVRDLTQLFEAIAKAVGLGSSGE